MDDRNVILANFQVMCNFLKLHKVNEFQDIIFRKLNTVKYNTAIINPDDLSVNADSIILRTTNSGLYRDR